VAGQSEKSGRHRRDARKGTQRERLVHAMIELAGAEGYGAVTIAGVIERAGVSRPTFYEYFPDTEACLLAALDQVQQHLLADFQRAVEDFGGRETLDAAIRAICELAMTEGVMSRVLMSEAMAGGPRALDLRDEGLREIDRAVERAYATAPAITAAPDVSPRMLTGGVYRLLARRLRRGEPVTTDLCGELEQWAKSYDRPLKEHRWRALSPSPPAVLPPARPPLLKPPPTTGRLARASSEQASQRRERILFAAAEIAEQQGYAAASIGEIAKRAGIDHRAFHTAFNDQHGVIAALHELFYQHLMTASAGAFFSEASWPQRVWDAGLAFTQTAEQNPTLAHVAFVEGPAAGPAAVQRFDDLVSAFTIFLQQGYEHQPDAKQPSATALEAIAWTTHEIAYAQSRASREPHLVGLLAHVTFLALAPFVGVGAADEFVDRKLKAGS
jgi:AcrR family transcriptional regulator